MNGTRSLVRALLLGLVLALSLAGPPTTAAEKPSVQTFDRDWVAHTRQAWVPQRGILIESVYDGCCDEAARVKYRLSQVRRVDNKVIARALVLRARYASWVPRRDRLHRGDVRRVWIRNRVLHTPTTFYCQNGYPRGICGA